MRPGQAWLRSECQGTIGQKKTGERRRTCRRYPLYAVVGEPEDAVVRVGYEAFCTRFGRDALRLDTGVGHPIQSFPPTNVEIAVHKKGSWFWPRERLGDDRLNDGVIGYDAWHEGVAR